MGLTMIQYLLLLAGEAAWIYPWSLLVSLWVFEQGESLLSPPVVLILLLSSLASTRRISSQQPLGRLLRLLPVLLGIVASCLVAFAHLSPLGAGGDLGEVMGQLLGTDEGVKAVLAAVMAALVWWRGIGLGRSLPGVAVVEEQFRTAIIAMTSLLILTALAGAAAPLGGEPLVFSALVLVFVGLVGMPLARIVEVSGRPRHGGSPDLVTGGPWTMMLVSVVATILLASLILAQLLSYDRIAAIWGPIQALLDAILRPIVYVLALPFGLLAQLIVFLVQPLLARDAAQQRPAPYAQRRMDQLEQGEIVSLAPEAILILKIVLALVVAGALIWLLLKAISRLGADIDLEGVEESRDSVWSWPGLGVLWRWLRGRRLLPRRRSVPSRGDAGEDGVVLTVRQMYRQFLRMGSELGRGRGPGETPLEYEERLRADPDLPGGAEIRSITESYVQARYGPPGTATPPHEGGVASDLSRLKSLWAGKSHK